MDSPSLIRGFVGVITIRPTGGSTVRAGLTTIVATAFVPHELAAIRTVPARTPVTMPSWETNAIEPSSLAHVTSTDGRTSPLASRTSAVSDRLEPTCTDAVCGATTIESTAAPGGSTAPLSHAVSGAAATAAPNHNARARDLTTPDCTQDSCGERLIRTGKCGK